MKSKEIKSESFKSEHESILSYYKRNQIRINVYDYTMYVARDDLFNPVSAILILSTAYHSSSGVNLIYTLG